MFGIECALTGRLGKDPELRMVKSGKMAMLSLNVAVDEAPPKDGQEVKSTWASVKLFGDRATAAADMLVKGDRVYCEGRLSLDEWTGQDGTPRHGLSVLANKVEAMGKIGRQRPRQDSAGRPQGGRSVSGYNRTTSTSASQRRAADAAQRPLHDDDMPNDAIPW